MKTVKELQEEHDYLTKRLDEIKHNETITETHWNTYYKLLSQKEEIEHLLLQIKQKRLTVAVDFDGVLNKYSGWNGENDLSTPQSGVQYFLKKLNEKYGVIVFTVRDKDKVKEWLKKYELDRYVIHVTDIKPKAVAYIDDRAIKYNGNYGEVLEKLERFKTWWE